MRPAFLALAMVLPLSALAGDYYVETPTFHDKAAAENASEAATEAGLTPRVVRRLGKGSGWSYLVRVEHLDDEAGARDAAYELARALHAAVGVYSVTDGAADLVATIEGETPVPAPDAVVATARPVTTEDAAPILEEVAKAHRVSGVALDGRPVRFTFRRDLGEHGVADHLFARRGDDLYLEVTPVSGGVVASRLKVIGDKAWLSVDGGPWQEQNGEKARQTAEAMGPTKVLPFILVLDAALDSRRELQRMETAGKGTVAGVDVDILQFEGDQAAGPVRVEVSSKDRTVQRVGFDGGELVYTYADVAKVGPFLLPTRVVTERDGKEVDRVTIESLDPAARMGDDWFSAP